jgi:TRAP-type uncharacterized transport system fused permease subunit
MGIDPMAAHMFILYYGCLSMITPPVAVAAFVAANLASADPNKTGWVAMAFGWTLFVIPFIFVYSPTLLMKGDPLFIIIDSLTAVAGVWFISAAVMGYSLRAMGWIDRLPHAIVGVLLLMPAGAFAAARWLNIAGALMAVAHCLGTDDAPIRTSAARAGSADASHHTAACRAARFARPARHSQQRWYVALPHQAQLRSINFAPIEAPR